MKKSKIKVLQFSIAKSMGGRTRYILDIWKWIDHERFQFDFVTFTKEIPIEEELLALGCTIHHLPCYPKENIVLFREAWNKVLDFGYDIVHLNTSYWDGFLLEECAYEKGVKMIIVHSHNTGIGKQVSDEERNRLVNEHYKLRETLDFGKITDFWACSKAAAEWLFGNRIKPEKVFITYPTINAKIFKFNEKSRIDCRKSLGISNEFVIGMVGRLVYQKNHIFLLNAFSKAFKGNTDIKLLILGNGDLSGKLKQLSYMLGINHQCIFVSNCENIIPYYHAMDLFVLPSLYEGFPKVVVEAVSSGLNCICADTITEEIKFCDLVQRIPLQENRWSRVLRKYKNTRDYEKRKSIVENEIVIDFDIRTEIIKIEERYITALEEKRI